MGVVNNKIALMGLEANTAGMMSSVRAIEATTAGLMTSVSRMALTVSAMEDDVTGLETAVSSGYAILPTLLEKTHTEVNDGTVENALANFMSFVMDIGAELAADEAVYFTDFVLDGYEMKPCGESNKIVTKSEFTAYINALRVGGFSKIVLDGTKVQIITGMARLSATSGYYITQTVSSDSTQNAVVKHAPSDSLTGGKTFKCHYYKLKKYSFD